MVYPGNEQEIQTPNGNSNTLSIHRSSHKAYDNGAVTFSQSQFKALLEVFGQVKINPDNSPTNKEKTNASNIDENGKSPNGRLADSSVSDAQEALCPLDTMLPDSKQPLLSPKSENSSPSKHLLSKMERKRMQWEKEKAEVSEWNPWGKPGAGAPRTLPIASVAPRTEHLSPDEEFVTVDGVKKQQWVKDLEEQRRTNQIQDNESIAGNMEDIDSISVSVDGSSAPYGVEGVGGRMYVRGQGFKLDPVSAAMAEQKRQKAQEYQQAILLQMQEKDKRLKEEKARQMREEEEEERRLFADRARIQAEYELEQNRQRIKKEVEAQKQAVMTAAVQKAEAEAAAVKKTRNVNKQKSKSGGDSDMENIYNSHSVHSSPRKACSRTSSPVPPQPPPKIIEPKQEKSSHEGLRISQQTATVKPLLSSTATLRKDETSRSATSTPRKELGVQTMPGPEGPSGYTENRVLTPSLYRVKSRGNIPKDFGTQTDNHYGRWIADDVESSDPSTSSLCPPVGKRLNRVQHSKPYKASRRQFNLDSLNERPKWGANQPPKSFIRMTERDPNFTKRKNLQELRKQHWEKEMASQQVLRNARKTNNNASHPMLRGRRHRSSSDGTAGLSSSEFEYNNVRSRCPQTNDNYGFRSLCGSAEDVAYSAYSSSRLPYVHERRNSQSSENVQSLIGGSEPASSRFSFPEVVTSNGVPMRRKWHSHETFSPQDSRDRSNQVPLIHNGHPMSSPKPSSLPSSVTHERRKWSDQESFDPESVALSHARLRCSSSGGGDDGMDRDSLSSADSSRKSVTSAEHNPLVCPEVVTRRPTPRQDRILQNLSSLKQGLLQKQKELESFIRHPPHIL